MVIEKETATKIDIAFTRDFDNRKYTAQSGDMTWPTDYGIPFKVDFIIRLNLPTGLFSISYLWNKPGDPQTIKQDIKLQVINSIMVTKYNLGPVWGFVCPLNKHKKCKKVCKIIYLGKEGLFGCKRCTKVYPRRLLISHEWYDIYMRNRDMIKRALANPYELPSRKMEAFRVMETLEKRKILLEHKVEKLKDQILRRRRKILFDRLWAEYILTPEGAAFKKKEDEDWAAYQATWPVNIAKAKLAAEEAARANDTGPGPAPTPS